VKTLRGLARDYPSFLAQLVAVIQGIKPVVKVEFELHGEDYAKFIDLLIHFQLVWFEHSLLPALDVLEERKRRKEIEEVLTEFAKEIILKLRMEDEVKGILWDPSECKEDKEGLRAKVWIVMSNMRNGDIIDRKVKECHEVVKIDSVFITPDELITQQNIDFMEILYGWGFIASIKPRIKRSFNLFLSQLSKWDINLL